MKKYKIKVNNEAESKEAQELFFALGGYWGQSKTNSFNPDPMSFIYFNGSSIYYGHDDENDEDFFLSGSSGKELTMPELRDLVAQKQVLISGADALRALADGKDVEFFYRDVWDSIGEMIVIDHFINDKFKFRLKPRTITLNIEIPAPFEPKVGEKYWFIADYVSSGYSDTQEGTGINSSIGKWRTEEEIKQVVAALRGIKG